MIMDAIANPARGAAPPNSSGCVACDWDFETIINRILQFLFAADVSLRYLHRSVAEQKLNLFQFAAAIMAEAGTGATKVVGRRDEIC